MKILLFSFMYYFLVLGTYGQNNGQIIAANPIAYPAYKDIKGISSYYDDATYNQAVRDKNLIIQRLTYYSDGLKVISYLATPKNIYPNRKYPVIIFNRGSYIRNDIAYVHAALFKKFVDSGFIVIAPALRESEGGEGRDEMGGKDLDDIWNILPLLKSKSYVDSNNLFMFGESRGGVMTLQLLKAGFPVKAAATVGAFADFGTFINENPGIENLCRQLWPDYDKDTADIFRQRSPIRWTDQIHVPLLLMAGSDDKSVNPHHTLDLAEQLNNFYKDYQLLIVNGGNHILSGKNLTKRDDEIIYWFRQHLSK